MLPPNLTAPQSPAQGASARRGRKAASFHSVHDLGAWMRNQPAVTQVVVIRTSDKDRAGFRVMFKAGIAMLPGDPDMLELGAVGAEIVTDAGARDRERPGAYELRRGSVPGGKGYALLGYVMVIGTTLVVLYLETARCADIPGATKDQTRNAFMEALCILLRHFRPQVCHTPLVSRVFRNMDFAGQLLRCLRDLRIRLVAEGSEIPLGRGDDELMTILRAWFASKEADGLVSRLGNIEIGLYLDGGWYLGEHLLPFTWRARSRTEVNALTGETVRVIEDTHQLEALAEARPLLHKFLRRAGQQATTRHQLGTLLGAGGVVSRAPRHAGKNVRLDSRPDTELAANAADTLLQERWLTAWEHGHYRRTIKLKADPRAAMPELADRVIDVDDELYLEIETLMPSPEGGWQVDELVAAVRTRLQADASRPASAGRKSKTGQQKPLNGLCQCTDLTSGVQYALTSLESGETYELRSRPTGQALDEHGVRTGWRKNDQWLCSISARLLHASVASAIREAVRGLEEQAAVLVLRPSTDVTSCPLVTKLARLRKDHQDAGARLEGIKQRRQTLEGKQQDGTLDVDEREALDELPGDEAKTREQRRAAAGRMQELKDELALQPEPEREAAQERQADAEFATIDLVAEGLARTGYRAPDALHELLARALRDFRVQPVSYDTAVTWTATLVVPLVAGGQAEFALQSDFPAPSSKRPPRRGDSNDTAGADAGEALSAVHARRAGPRRDQRPAGAARRCVTRQRAAPAGDRDAERRAGHQPRVALRGRGHAGRAAPGAALRPDRRRTAGGPLAAPDPRDLPRGRRVRPDVVHGPPPRGSPHHRLAGGARGRPLHRAAGLGGGAGRRCPVRPATGAVDKQARASACRRLVRAGTAARQGLRPRRSGEPLAAGVPAPGLHRTGQDGPSWRARADRDARDDQRLRPGWGRFSWAPRAGLAAGCPGCSTRSCRSTTSLRGPEAAGSRSPSRPARPGSGPGWHRTSCPGLRSMPPRRRVGAWTAETRRSPASTQTPSR